MPYLGIIADDLTGAADTASVFHKIGLSSIIILGFAEHTFRSDPESWNALVSELGEAIEVVAVTTQSRALPASAAGQLVRIQARSLLALGTRCLYKKIDSLLRGNIGAEVDALLNETPESFALVTPAFPSNGRITIDGIHLIHGRPVAETEAGRDPVTPVLVSHVPTLLAQQSRFSIGHLPLAKVRDGAATIAQEIEDHRREGARIISADAASEADLAALVEGARAAAPALLLAGSAGLAGVVASLGPQEVERPVLTRRSAIITSLLQAEQITNSLTLTLVGSLSPVARVQVNKLANTLDARVLEVDVAPFFQGTRQAEEEIERIAILANQSLHRGQDTIISTAPARATGALPAVTVAAAIAARLGQIGYQVGRHPALTGLALVGGDSAFSVLEALSVQGVMLTDELAPGIAGGWLIGGQRPRLPVVTKAGAFGDEDALVNMVAYLKRQCSAEIGKQ